MIEGSHSNIQEGVKGIVGKEGGMMQIEKERMVCVGRDGIEEGQEEYKKDEDGCQQLLCM